MKYIKQFGIILIISLVGEILNRLISLPVPASIYGIVIMFLCLQFKIVKIESVKKTSMFLIDIMPLMFIPAAVGLLESWNIIKPVWLPYIAVTVVSTFVVMVISGIITQLLILHNKKKVKADD